MNKKKLVRYIFSGVSISLMIAFAFFAIFFLVLSADRSLWFLVPSVICVLCCGITSGIVFYMGED